MSYLFDLRTVSTPQIVAKDAPKRIPPALSYADMVADAKAARARQRALWGERGNQFFGNEANSKRTATAIARDEAASIAILEDLRRNGEKRWKQILQDHDLTDEVLRRIVKLMKSRNQIEFRRCGRKGAVWSAIE
jgi:hypothetical protein